MEEEEEEELRLEELVSDVLRRKSWVTAMPIEAKERDVRSQARKVRSVWDTRQYDATVWCVNVTGEQGTYRALGDL